MYSDKFRKVNQLNLDDLTAPSIVQGNQSVMFCLITRWRYSSLPVALCIVGNGTKQFVIVIFRCNEEFVIEIIQSLCGSKYIQKISTMIAGIYRFYQCKKV